MYKVLISTIIGGIIGWLTNIIAIKMLFRPIRPVKILTFKIQGLIPKRKAELAVSIGQTVEMELIDFKDIFERIVDEGSSDRIVQLVKRKTSQNIYERLPSLVPNIIKNAVIQYLEEQIDREAPQMIEDLIHSIYEKASAEVKIGKIIEERINSFDLIKIEEITLRIAKNELKHIEILGGVLGAIIGLFQGLLLLLYI